jgi:hypothetical protein
MDLFKVVLCTWGKIVGEGLCVAISRATLSIGIHFNSRAEMILIDL